MSEALYVAYARIADLFTDGEHGLYVRPGDPGAMRDAIVRLLQNPGEVERMGKAAREKVLREHTLDACMGRFAEVIRTA